MKQKQVLQNTPNTKMFKLTDIFHSIQGEGLYTGMSCIFVRFAGCNMSCDFCDTDYGKRYEFTQVALFRKIETKCNMFNTRNVVLTGGEPLRQNIDGLMRELAYQGYHVHLETNGSIEIDYNTKFLLKSISMGPKVPIDKIKLTECTSLKILFPYLEKIRAEDFFRFDSKFKYLCPICPKEIGEYIYNINSAIRELEKLPDDWQLGIQLHKLLNWS